MKGKVKCTCGWSWNKSDSSKKDMYICHECGRDNSNNMKNGGWLDNYNDSEVSLPEGFVGEGIFNGPKFDNPAWGGQFQMGGSVYPVNYVSEAQTGGSFPGATGFSYARTGSIPSKGPRRNQTDVTDASAQNGKEMQYYQQGLDFQPKTISKNGGWLDGYDKAQDGKTVKYGTPEYEEAYNKGEIVTKEGVRSPILLDEVVIQNNYKRPRGFWEQYKDKIVEENKDAGVLGAIIGTPISAVASLPQLAMMKLFTDKMQRPSEAIGFENNEELFESPSSFGKHAFNFLLDAVTDPANLIGAGVLTKENALAKLAASKESGLLSRAHELNPWAFKSKPEAYYRQIYGEKALNSPIITRSMSSANDPKGISTFVTATEETHHLNDTPVNILKLPRTSTSANDALPYFNKGEKYYGSNNFKDQPKEFLLESNFNAKDYEDFYPAAMRDVSIDPSQSDIANKMFGDVRVLNPFSKEGHDINNYNLYKKDWLQGYKKIPKQEDGGVIKDDNGYWNPDNWGKVVEIGSNDITMKGVDQPLLGISDTGDTKLMKPGKNYKFKGKKVTEFPMAKNGLRQEQKGLVNLDNLLNFSNYNKPQPGGWLNKYN